MVGWRAQQKTCRPVFPLAQWPSMATMVKVGGGCVVGLVCKGGFGNVIQVWVIASAWGPRPYA